MSDKLQLVERQTKVLSRLASARVMIFSNLRLARTC